MTYIIPLASELTPEEQEKIRTLPRYPEIDSTILTLQSWTRHALTPFNIPLSIEIKRDGSNMRLFYLGNDRYALLSRNQYAADDFIHKVMTIMSTPYNPLILWPDQGSSIRGRGYEGMFEVAKEGYLVFFELFGKGVFPGFDVDSPPCMEIIDIYDMNGEGGFLKRETKEKICEKYHAPIVPLLYKGKVANIDEYWKLINPFIDLTWNQYHKEGMVIKGFLTHFGQIFIKEKHPEAIKASRAPREEKDGKVVVDLRPVLDDTEINGAIKKVHVEIGDKIGQKEIAMPRIAGMVQEECKKHDMRFPNTIFRYYQDYLKKLAENPNLLALDDIEYRTA
jgi:hypothetical protein